MICRVGDETYAGRAVELSANLDPATVAAAVRTGRAEAGGTVVAVDAREPGPLHERVGCLTPDVSIRPRTALAVAARTRGWATPVDDQLAAARDRLAAHEVGTEPSDAARHRRRIAETGDEVERLRERVAEARGRVRAANDGTAGRADSTATRNGGTGVRDDGNRPAATLEDAVRSLTEVETTVAAAREDHRAARASARATRHRLQERLRLEDAVANLEREARAHLVERARRLYEAALSAVPGAGRPEDPFEAAPDAMALAAARVGDVAAPVVLACGRFADATAAARWLDAPVVSLEP